MIRRTGTLLLTSSVLCVISALANGQSIARSNPALTAHVSDAGALDTSGRAFFQYGTGENLGYTTAAGIRTWGGMLRATYSHSYLQTVWGVGYARMLAAKDAGRLGTLGAGVDLTGAMDFRQRAAVASRAGSLAIPLSLRWGSPSRLSIAPYVAPYAEIGRATTYQPTNCDQSGFFCSYVPAGLVQTHAFGLESGVQLTAWRLSFEFGVKDMSHTALGYSRYQGGAGLRLRF
jgi:hypothetical protein